MTTKPMNLVMRDALHGKTAINFYEFMKRAGKEAEFELFVEVLRKTLEREKVQETLSLSASAENIFKLLLQLQTYVNLPPQRLAEKIVDISISKSRTPAIYPLTYSQSLIRRRIDTLERAQVEPSGMEAHNTLVALGISDRAISQSLTMLDLVKAKPAELIFGMFC